MQVVHTYTFDVTKFLVQAGALLFLAVGFGAIVLIRTHRGK